MADIMSEGGMHMDRKKWRQIGMILAAGFAAGIFYANFAGKNYVSSTGIFHEYFLSEYADTQIAFAEYLPYLVRWRGIPLLLFLAAGRMGAYKIPAVAALLWTGFSGGVVLVAAVMRMGAAGIFFCLAALFPQILFYASGWAVLVWSFYRMPEVTWNRGKTVFTAVMMVTGLLTEAALNPSVVKWALHIFY